MFFLGHLGIGYKLAVPWGKGLPKKAILLGTILPDLIDKPVYYGLSFITGKKGADLGMIAGTRTFGHTALFLIVLSFVALLRKSRALAALALGVATHLLLDNLGDRFALKAAHFKMAALLWPLQGWQFPIMPYESWQQQLGRITYDPFIIWTEALGLCFLLWEAWKAKKRGEILMFIRHQRQEGSRKRFGRHLR